MAIYLHNPVMVYNVISLGTRIYGEIQLRGTLRIEGSVEGAIYNQGKIYISSSGKIKADIHAEEVIIGGELNGNVFAREAVKLLRSAKVKGCIYSKTIAAEEGSVFEGESVITQ